MRLVAVRFASKLADERCSGCIQKDHRHRDGARQRAGHNSCQLKPEKTYPFVAQRTARREARAISFWHAWKSPELRLAEAARTDGVTLARNAHFRLAEPKAQSVPRAVEVPMPFYSPDDPAPTQGQLNRDYPKWGLTA